MRKTSLFSLLALTTLLSAGHAQQLTVGIAFDSGGKNDKSFNQSAYTGAMRAAKDFKVMVKDFEPADPSQVGQGIQAFASNGFDLVLGVGFANEGAITRNAKAYGDQAFALVDAVSDAKNVASLTFRENEGSYLAGYLAAKKSSTGVLGFIGGMDVTIVQNFLVGYTAGAKAANPKVKVISQFVGNTSQAWNDPAKAKEIATTMKSRGADIIFAAAGASGNGLIDFVKSTQCIKKNQLPKGVTFKNDLFKNVPKSESYTSKCAGDSRPMFFIGVDSNQNYLGDTDNNPKTLNHGLTSMLKRVDNAVYSVIQSVQNNTFKGGARSYGLKENGVDVAIDEFNTALVSKQDLSLLDTQRKAIVAGKIKVPDAK
ncbi:BMP family lipoprotein [Deinococcus misasensis]|uniref:BMP family lipoprotein n=1 Tax=Deinococcus misasensis TaxID=392413 RepID=UPI000551D600|nr:BMP family ABC transporter substrate-binding protein [Deinococcus misasensis]